MRIWIGMTIAAMAALGYLTFNSTMDFSGITNPVKPSQCPTTASVAACPVPPIQTYEIPDSTQAEWKYCGNDNGPCTVHALVDGQWAIVELVKP